MMARPVTVEELIDELIEREGGFVDLPEDRGGPTKFGITKRTLAESRGRVVTTEDVRQLGVFEARAIYRERYIERPGYDAIGNPGLRSLVVDAAVHHGPRRATEMLQKALGVVADGVIGPETRHALSYMDPEDVYRKVVAARVRLYGRIVTDSPTQAKFAAGWANRIAGFIERPPA